MQFKTTFVFQFGNAGWTESWYREADTPEAAATVTDQQWQTYMTGRADGCVLRAIRSAKVGQPRVSYIKIMNKTVGTMPGHTALGGEPPEVALQCLAQCADFRKRSAHFLGLEDLNIARGLNGFPIFNAALLQTVAALKSSLISMGAQMQALRVDPVGNPYRTIVQFAKGAGNAETTSIQYSGLAIPAGSKVVVSGIHRWQWPGLGGPITPIAISEDSLILPIKWRQPADTLPGNGAKIRVVQYDYPLVRDLQAQDVRSRKVGRPSMGYRGRRSGYHFHSA